MKRILVVSCVAIGLAAGITYAQVPKTGIEPRAPKGLKLPPQQKPPSNAWLRDADSDGDCFRKLEINLRGFDEPMREVGHRYQAVYDAIKDKNYGLADSHWDKVKVAINGGPMKRPARTQNAEGMFLDSAWGAMDEAIKSKDHARIVKQFEATRQVCMACPTAEKVPFMNDQPLFRNTASFSQ